MATSADDPHIRKYSVTIDQLLSDAGGVGQTRKIADPKYPNADGSVTWVASDPLRGTDPGGNARFWARYPDGSGGFWRRDDWNALTVGVGRDNAISLDWAAFDEAEDVSIVFQELWTQYINGAAGNICSIKGPEDVSTITVGGLDITGDGSASAFYWYRPLTRKCIVRTKPYELGTEDLIAKTWTNLGSNRWSATVTENVAHLRTADPGLIGNSTGTKGPWLQPPDLRTTAATVNSFREWHCDSGTNTLTVFATSNPSTYFATGTSSTEPGMIYYTDVTNLDRHGKLTNVHKIYIEGGGSRYHSNFGLEMRGRAGMQPWAGGGANNGLNGWDCVYTNRTFVKAGSFCTFLPGASEYSFHVIGFSSVAVNHQLLEKVTIGGLGSARYAPTNSTSSITDWWHAHKGDSTGDQFKNIRLWGEMGFGWDGTVSPSGADSATGPTNVCDKPWPMQTVNRQNNFKKITGHYEGMGGNPFIGLKGSVQIGESLADPYKWTVRGGTFTNPINADVYTPNGRPVYFDDNSSAAAQFDKTDTLNCVRGGTNFMWFENLGIVHPLTDKVLTVDIRDDPVTAAADVLNVVANPGDLDLGLRNAVTIFEVTIETGPGGIAGLDLKVTGPGQGKIPLSGIDARFPMNWAGYIDAHGINDACRMALINVPQHTTIKDFTFAPMFSGGLNKPEVAVAVHTGQYFNKANNVTVQDCTLQGNRTIDVGGFGGGHGPYNVLLTDLTVTGTVREAIRVIPFHAGWFNEGNPITIIANSVAKWDAGMGVDIISGTSGDVYFSDDGGTTWYEPGYTVGGSNTTKSAPPDLVGLNSAFRSFANASSAKIYMPQFFADGNHCTVVMWWNGDPGTVTRPAGFAEIAGAADNLADCSLYVKAYHRVYATGTDCWDETGVTSSNSDSITKQFRWTGGNRSGWGYATEHTGQNATPIGNANSQPHDSASTTHTAPTVTTTTDSMIMSFIGMTSDAQVTNFAGTLSPWMVKMPKDHAITAWGVEGTDFLPGDSAPGVSMCAAEIYAGAGGSKAGCAYTVDASTKALTTSIEIKT